MFDVTSRITTTSYRIIRMRRATLKDIPALQRLIETSLRSLGTSHYTPAQIESALKYAVPVDPELIQDGTFYVVEHGSQIIASGAWSRRGALHQGDDAGNALLDPAHDPARARTFYVHPDWTRRGLGSWLMQECLTAAWAAGFKKVELLATHMGRPLYARFGFHEIEPVALKLPDGTIFPVTRMIKALNLG